MRGGVVILQALTRYYETLLEQGEISPRYYSKTGVSFGLRLNKDGGLAGIVPLEEPVENNGKTVDRPKRLDLPESVVRSSGVASNFLWDNATYLLGIDTKGNPKRAIQCFECAKILHLSILDGIDSETAASIRAFFSSWQPEQAFSHVVVQKHMDELLGSNNLVFLGINDTYAFEDPLIRAAWEAYRAKTASKHRGQCLVSGLSDQPIETVHPKVKGVRGGQTSGTSLVSANATAFESYGQSGNSNSPVSEYAAFAYTSALNHLIADFRRRMSLDGDTIVCWAENGETIYQDAFLDCVNPRYDAENQVSQTLKRIVNGSAVDLEGFSVDTPFYVLCLSPNAARVSVRFFLRDTFGNIADHLSEHYRRLEIAMNPNERQYLSPYWMLKETVPPGGKGDASSPLLSGATLRAILSGAPYPRSLYENILLRIRADRKINRARAATIKAYLLQNDINPEHKEVLIVALNEQSTNKPYVLGRLFALLEQAQESASPGIKATITDRYFDSACATPKLAFPTLLKLNRHHLAKDDKWGRRHEKQIGELADKLSVDNDPYPARLTLEEQGLFILGYYQQKQARYTKKTESDSEKENV
ncbi:MAG: type I-C CRISPR-associated protein Cas8c/Csd1 [Eubacteriales bacterium]|nr:type I-C CRISPR-associated protein Cas8c/Csd1 [Eubacteriales bacterium]